MNEISVNRLYEFYRDAIERCNSNALSLSEEEIEYNLFEEFDIAATSFFHDDSLRRLFVAGLIDKKAMEISREIRREWNWLREKDWSMEEIKRDIRWKKLFESCDELLMILPPQKWGQE